LVEQMTRDALSYRDVKLRQIFDVARPFAASRGAPDIFWLEALPEAAQGSQRAHEQFAMRIQPTEELRQGVPDRGPVEQVQDPGHVHSRKAGLLEIQLRQPGDAHRQPCVLL